MKDLIKNFPTQLKEAIEICENASFHIDNKTIESVVIAGLGGSGIGGNFAQAFISDDIHVPIVSVKGYFAPTFINEHTLFITSSYSGNTEETLNALKKAEEKGCEIACITSGGKLFDMANKNDYNFIKIPGGNPPRSALGYSVVAQMYLLHHYELIHDKFKQELKNSIKLLENEQENIMELAASIAKKIAHTIPVLYADDKYESSLVRWRQQINENGKMLCWHHVVPEMNHNELVGWRTQTEDISVIFLRNDNDYDRVQQRIELNKEIIGQYTDNIIEVYSKGNSRIERTFYFIHLGDWVSWYLSEERKVDATEVNVIDHLKGELAKISW